MKARLALAAAALLASSAFAPAPFPRPRRGDDAAEVSLRTMQGLWRVEGFALTSGTGDHARRDWHIKYVRIQDRRWNFMNSATSPNAGYDIEIDGGRRPAALDFFDAPRGDKSRPCGLAIVRREGHRACIIYTFSGGPEGRAAGFERPPEGQWIVWLVRDR